MRTQKILVIVGFVLSMTACHHNPDLRSSLATDTKADQAKAVAEAEVRLGVQYLENNDAIRAKSALLRAMQHDPQLPAAWYTLGYLYEATGELRKAEQCYLRSIRLAPQAGAPRNNFATYLCRHGKYKEAVEAFVQAANMPDYLYVAAAYENAGLCALLIPDDVAAAGYFQKAVMNNPKQAASLLELAKLYYLHGDVGQAKNYLARYELTGESTSAAKELKMELGQ
ncbi:MAG: type IV pilus biogenesis/stability protein PilW [Gammaproteobacteria bacterium RIFCSPHIGHO2_12_FULL_41_15]|nr:MAG: type IV pilus biogenesis/stability protein PilW [Gammaproteobacteria bacterium RIFCSPHIGHO2_12_FULL_41_15]